MRRRRSLERARRALIEAIGPFEVGSLDVYRSRKVIHDPVWGTCVYHPWEMSLLGLKVFQRLRSLKQTGFAYFTYPAAEHSRFQHTLGVVEAASKIFRSIIERLDHDGLSPRGIKARLKRRFPFIRARRFHVLVRVAALVHDLGHSLFSHTSERIYGLIPPFDRLAEELKDPTAKPPGAAEMMVYLLVTSRSWQEAVTLLWKGSTKSERPPSKKEWERIGRWVMGQEADPRLKFVADIISGPLDADKLDYVFRDGYVAGIPVGYDLERLVATICVDPQKSRVTKKQVLRLTIPIKGINALEQLVMGRLVLNSYLYHHQKCRAAECAFERMLAREYLQRRSVLGLRSVWKLFDVQDEELAAFAKGRTWHAREARRLQLRRLRVRIAEFRYRDLQNQSEETSAKFDWLLGLANPSSWNDYRQLLRLEDQIAREAGLAAGEVMVDVPKDPGYADLQELLLPGRRPEDQERPEKVLNYRDWIAAYKVHRQFVRVFGPRGRQSQRAVWHAARKVFAQSKYGLVIPPAAWFPH